MTRYPDSIRYRVTGKPGHSLILMGPLSGPKKNLANRAPPHLLLLMVPIAEFLFAIDKLFNHFERNNCADATHCREKDCGNHGRKTAVWRPLQVMVTLQE